ncbi:flavin reductase family protein [Streptomyces sp. G3]|jgi:flavin reductase (DIM6/NTAB) family NADH-FMN oxidoreductase RutF|uniref:flavin reductase family protein n=1 Tax=Streptomyces TaxID=1883 RepID=UPI000F71DB02|nr:MULTISPECIES: flavin reductase family protein [Streptomyces]AZM75440.1 flavin reductase [Streptomyces sp. KPB2]NDZ72039.1 flavin reductase family protein [Streptomyces sp. SID10362]MCM1942115.1 flavin reductase family protein [Streptomyces sp. G3]MCQ4205422.1 flavin reductase family protein [Streptomyces coelicoflavus]MCV2464909.1 flavin reductase family protein [Streptomyces sp. ICN988]
MGQAPAADHTTGAVDAPDDLRAVMRHFATGVCVVSTHRQQEDGLRHSAVTVNSLTSVSLEPPLVSVSFRSDSSFLTDLMEARVWGISILDGGSEELARLFARPRAERDEAVRTRPAEPGPHTGALLFEAAGWMECRYRDHVVAGDHVMVIGDVVGLGVRGTRTPLIFLQGGFHRFEPPQT